MKKLFFTLAMLTIGYSTSQAYMLKIVRTIVGHSGTGNYSWTNREETKEYHPISGELVQKTVRIFCEGNGEELCASSVAQTQSYNYNLYENLPAGLIQPINSDYDFAVNEISGGNLTGTNSRQVWVTDGNGNTTIYIINVQWEAEDNINGTVTLNVYPIN